MQFVDRRQAPRNSHRWVHQRPLRVHRQLRSLRDLVPLLGSVQPRTAKPRASRRTYANAISLELIPAWVLVRRGGRGERQVRSRLADDAELDCAIVAMG